jgi:hypothetical protein
MKRLESVFGMMFVIVLLVFVVGGLQGVSAQEIAVTTTHSDNFPLEMEPGDEVGVFFIVDNLAELTITVVIEPGDSDIAEFIENDLTRTIPSGGQIRVPVVVKIPEGTDIGEEYKVGAVFKVVPSSGSDDEGGGVSFRFSLGKDFPVKVVGNVDPGDLKYVEEIEEEGIRGAPTERGVEGEGGKGIWVMVVFFLALAVLVVGIILFLSVRRKSSRLRVGV